MTIKHTRHEWHELELESADPFGVTYKTGGDKTATVKVYRISFTTHPNVAYAPTRGFCHIHGRLLRKTGGEGRNVMKTVSLKYDRELWDQIPGDIKAVMFEHGFTDGEPA